MKKSYLLKRLSIIIIVSALAIINVIAQPSAPSGKIWEKVNNLSDEFNSWDGDKWTKPLWNYDVPNNLVAENSGVSDGKLWIKATLGSGDRWFKTSRVMSKAQVIYPMYTECRMKTSHISAYNTYWLNNGDSDDRDEIDICENTSNPVNWYDGRPYTMFSQYFIVKDGDVERDDADFDNRNLSDWNPAKGVKWNAAYQTLGCYWEDAHNVTFYINGEKTGSVKSTRSFTRNLNIIWDLWTLGADWSVGLANKDHLSDNNINTMYVDWIHTYKLIDNNSEQVYIINRETGKKLRSPNSTDGSKLELVPGSWTGSLTKWTIVSATDGYVYLKNVSSGMYFRPGSSSDGSALIQRPTSYTGSYTQWKRVNTSGDYFYLKNRETGMYFRPEGSADYSSIIQRPTSYTGSWTQWKFIAVDNGKSIKSSQLGTEQNTEQIVDKTSIYPNPVSNGVVTIETDISEGKAVINIFNISGKLVYDDIITEQKTQLLVEDFDKGMYLVKIHMSNCTSTQKLIID